MTLRLNGSTSGYVEIDAPATAGSNTIVLPSSNGSANQLLKNSSTAGSLEFSSSVYIDSSQRLLVGTSTARSVAYIAGAAQFQVEGTDYLKSAFSIVNNESSNNPATICLGRSRGTSIGSNTSVADGDWIGRIGFAAADGTDLLSEAASIACLIDGAVGSNDTPGRLVFSTTADGASSPTERMRITQAGQVFIGRTSLIDDTTLAGSVAIQSLSTALEVYRNTSASSYTIAQFFSDVGSTASPRFQFRADGGLANYSANNVNLSDRNVKKDIAPVAGTWDCLKEWEIVNFRYKDQSDEADLSMGVIAQQVAESCPEVITVFQEAKEATEDRPAQEERLGVKEQQMMWMAIKALQEAQLRIETLETANAALEARLTALEGGAS